MPSFRIVCLTPAGLTDPAIAIAATRAGELGVLNLEFTSSASQARASIDRLVRFTSGPVGVRFGVSAGAFVTETLAALPDQVTHVIVSGAESDRLASWIRDGQAGHREMWVEVTDVRQAGLAVACAATGLVAKGHESGGWVGEETTFVLLQRLRAECQLPVWAFGGIGMHTATAAIAGGADGVVLDLQLALMRESALPVAARKALESMDGSETLVMASATGQQFRAYTRPKLAAVAALSERFRATGDEADAFTNLVTDVNARVQWNRADAIWPVGQDASFAKKLAARFTTVSAFLPALRRAVSADLATAARLRPLEAHAPLANAHGTTYPIVQGPMTRVSDTAAFAAQVADGGGLPFLALALMRADEVDALMRETQALLGDRQWGVGVLGFVPAELRQEQLEVIRRYRPRFVLIAGGRPDQARKLESEGITTYLHVPSPGLLRLFLSDGARHFVFEGRECGGHVGPRSSFVLWDAMIDVLLADVSAADASSCQVLFAGGIHDALSASMVAAMAAPLAERGIKVGVLVGTAYLFTTEAVSGGAIMPEFQQRAMSCDDTVLIESGVGHAVRCIPNAFTVESAALRRQLIAQGLSAEEIRFQLEELNIGRLRVASKGVKRNPEYQAGGTATKLVSVDESEQWHDGMYMIGQVASLRRETVTIAALHEDIAVAGSARLTRLAETPDVVASPPTAAPSNIAIIGISTLLPKAPDVATFWKNVLNKVYAIGEVPAERWDWRTYFDADRTAKDKIYSRWGGFLDNALFDPLEFGMPPNSVPSIDPMQLLALNVAKAALHDAGYLTREFDRQRTAVILGASGGSGELGTMYNLRSGLPLVFGDSARDIIAATDHLLPEWTEDSFAGLLPNVASGRIANRFDLGGVNYVVDAACASSLAAVHQAVKELETGGADMVLVGGVDTVQTPFGFLCFSKTQALSPTGTPRTFDADADGIAISEGLVMLVLKRLDDAERDGDRIYAVIQGTAGSSDGKAKGLTAPRPEGQQLALERAYAKAGVDPTSVGLFEAHGTGTVVGDRTEAVSLAAFLEANGAAPARHAVGSVKSMIGHTKATAGVAGLAKVALALHHKVLPATLGVTTPNPKARFGDGPLYVNSETRPWIQSDAAPRRAGVSAFGFGGTNFHVVVEEYTGAFLPSTDVATAASHELLVWSAPSDAELASQLDALHGALAAGAAPSLADLAFTLASEFEVNAEPGRAQAAVVATSVDELHQRLPLLASSIRQGVSADSAKGAYWTPTPLARDGGVAMLFPGQGSQSPNMLRDLSLAFDDVRGAFERADRTLQGRFPQRLSDFVYPPPAFSPEAEKVHERALMQTNVAQPALGAANVGLLRLLEQLGVHADAFAGHSYGEFVALHAAGVIDEATLFTLSEGRGRSIIEAAVDDLGTMAAVTANDRQVAAVLDGRDDVWLANLNAPQQTVISGTRAGIAWAVEQLNAKELRAVTLPVACAFHSPLVAPARERLSAMLEAAAFTAPLRPVFSNTTAAPYGDDPAVIKSQLAEHLVRPVRFAEQVLAMHASGIRVFLEVGPRSVLTTLVGRILGDAPHASIATDQPGRGGVPQLLHALAQLVAQGCRIQPTQLFRRRQVRALSLARLADETRPVAPSATAWLVNGGSARRVNQPVRPAPVLTWSPSGTAQLEPQRAMMVTTNNDRGGTATGTVASGRPIAPVNGATAVPAMNTPVAAHGASRDADQVMLQFQGLMGKFLDTQRQVMVAYLGGSPALVAPSARLSAPALTAAPVAVTTAAVTAASTAASTAAVVVTPVVADAPGTSLVGLPTSPHVPTRAELTSRLLQIVSDRTGYPTDMLSLDADVEAELGIDSIKRVEIVGVLQRAFLSDDATLGEDVVEQLTSLKTLGGIVGWLENAVGRLSAAANDSAALPNATTTVATFSAADLQQRLLQIVSDRTGYPIDMLTLEADVEAELGIDSIKRVEILGVLQKDVFSDESQLGAEMMEQLTAVKTLGGIVDWIVRALTDVAGPVAAIGAPERAQRLLAAPAAMPADASTDLASDVASAPTIRDVPRRAFVSERRELSPRRRPSLLAASRTVLITDDGLGVGRALLATLLGRGMSAVLVQPGAEARSVDTQHWTADFSSEDGVRALYASLAAANLRVGALAHLAPLGAAPTEGAESLTSWRDRLQRDVKSLFYLLKVGSLDLPGGFAVAAANMGGLWGIDDDSAQGADGFAGHGAIAGIMKTAAQEWPGVHCRALDFDWHTEATEVAAMVMQEVASADEQVQAGYRNGVRHVPVLREVTRLPDARSKARLDRDAVVLVTGGARGITAKVTVSLAHAYHPRLILVGRSAAPSAEEDVLTAGSATANELKAFVIARQRSRGATASIPEIERECARILQDREIRANLATLRATATSVEYVQADVCDERAMTDLVSRIMGEYGRIDVLLHGAGVIEDKRIEDKTAASFDRVFDTKADSALLLRSLLPPSVHTAILFSSAAGAFGNKGQADYAAANEVLNSLARQWGGGTRAVAIGWGPWAGSGMVNPLLEQEFARRGIELISSGGGCQVVDAILRSDDGPAAIVAGAWDQSAPTATTPDDVATGRGDSDEMGANVPLVAHLRSRHRSGVTEFVRTFDPSTDVFLLDHRLDGIPVMPFAMATELAAEAAQAGWPDLQVSGIRDFERLRGIVFGTDPLDVLIAVRALDVTMDDRVGVDVAVELSDADNPAIKFYRGVVEMASVLPQSPALSAAPTNGLAPFSMSVPEFYREWLFHGALFQNITRVDGVSRTHVVARVRPSRPVDLVTTVGTWLIDPVVLDCGLQLVVLWTREHYDMTPLPARFGRYRRFAALDAPEMVVEAVIREDRQGHSTLLDVHFRDASGKLLAILESLEATASKGLNRLGGAPSSLAAGRA